MPLIAAVASPELASGKVFIHYPIAQPQQESMAIITNEEMLEQQSVHETSVSETANITASQSDVLAAPVVAEVVKNEVQDVAVEAINTEETSLVNEATTVEHPVESTAITADNTVIAPESEAVEAAQDAVEIVAEVIKPQVATPVEVTQIEVVETVTIVSEQTAPVTVDDAVEEAQHIETAVAAPVEVTSVEEIIEPVTTIEPTMVTISPVVSLHKRHAFSPMTKAPAPDVAAVPFEIKEYQREASTFEGKGGAGGHVASNVATSAMAKPTDN